MRRKTAAKPRSFDVLDALDVVFNIAHFFSPKNDTSPQKKYEQPKKRSLTINIAELICAVNAHNNYFMLYAAAADLVENAEEIVIHGETKRDTQGTQYIKAPAFCDRYVAIDNTFMRLLEIALDISMENIRVCDTQELRSQRSPQSQRTI